MTTTRRLSARLVAAVVLGVLCTVIPALAIPPAPPNDTPATAEIIGPVPVRVFGTTVQAASDINAAPGLPGIDPYVDGPDVFYGFTPDASGPYRVQLLPWQKAPLRSSDRRFTIYLFDDNDTFLAGARAPGDARPVHFDVTLTAGTQYTIGVDHAAETHDNFTFTLLVDAATFPNPDDCAGVHDLPATTPSLVLNEIGGAWDDFGFTQSGGRCAVANTTAAPGNDHVYRFTAPADGDYAIELASSGFDAVLYVNEVCPPLYPEGCLGASNHSTSTSSGGRHELVVVTLSAGVDCYIYVDNGSTTNPTGSYALIVDDAFTYEITEIEPNDFAAEATPIITPLNGGQLVGPGDEDWFLIDGLAGDRVFAWANNGGSSNSTLDTDMGFYAADGTTLVEFDDEDADGADAPIEDLRYIYSTSAPVLAGVELVTDAPHFLRVTKQNETGTVHRYRLHVGVEPGDRTPLSECEPNDTIAQADVTGKDYFTGAVTTTDDSDFYAFKADKGERVFIALDGDPERDSSGFDSAGNDPNAFNARLTIYDPDGDVLISDISDSNSAQTPPADYPAQGGFFVVKSSGTHYVEVSAASSQVGPTETYELAIFKNASAPPLTEVFDPVIDLTPDFEGNIILGAARDELPGDTGVCDIELYAETNLQLTNVGSLPGAVVTFNIELIDTQQSGFGKLLVTDCAGNTACQVVTIDVFPPICDGFNFSQRTPASLHDPIHVTDNDSTGIFGTIDINEPGAVNDVNVTVNIDTLDTGDLDIYLVSPQGTVVELVTDRMSSLGTDMVEVTFDDSAEEILPILGSAAPYTGTWLPEDPQGLAQLNGEDAQGTWQLNVIDDSSSDDFGATLVRWALEIEAGFAGPETFSGLASDDTGFDAGIASIELIDPVNVELTLPDTFEPGDLVVPYTVTLIDPTQDGAGTVLVTDLQANICESIIALNGVADTTGPDVTGSVTTDLTIKREVQQIVPPSTPSGVVSTITIDETFLVGEVEVALTVDSENQGRIAARLAHSGSMASLVNRIGMDDRGAAGNTKNSFDVLLDDDAPQEDDIHVEPALGSVATLGLHQPDGRGKFFGDGITTDRRDSMLFELAGTLSAGAWDLLVADTRMISASENIFRRWALTLKSPCGPERFVGRVLDVQPGAGVCTIALADGATNLMVVADFAAGAEVVDFRVELVDPNLPGSGTLEVTDCANNTTQLAIALAAASSDQDSPVVGGALNGDTLEFEGTATDAEPTDSGIASVELAPYSTNLQIVSVTPDPPNGAASVDFVIGLIDPMQNGRGYVRITDGCGWRAHKQIEIDATPPECSGTVGHTKRYISTHQPLDIPDNNPQGVVSSIYVPDEDIIADVDITINIRHPFDDDIDLILISPPQTTLFTDIGSTGNDFIDTTLDDEAAEPIPDSFAEAPFTGRYQPEAGPILQNLDGEPALGDWNLRIIDDKTNDTGEFLSWAVTITADTFPERFDGRVEDSEPLASGVCTIELLPDAENLALVVDPFESGDAIVRYSVELMNLNLDGTGTVRITDCGGSFCEIPVALTGAGFPLGDMDCDGDVDFDDISPFVVALGGEAAYAAQYPDCVWLNGDIDGNGTVDFDDISPFVALLSGK